MATESLQMSPDLLEGFSPLQKVFDGKVFPKILTPSFSAAETTQEGMLEILQKHKTFLEEQLHECGAVLLRGFPLQSAEDFDAALEAIGWKNMPYMGTSVRTQLTGRVSNASGTRAELFIPYHHEMMQVKSGAPPKVVFFCEIEPLDGGQTSILLSHKVAGKMQMEFPDFVRKIEEEGLIYLKTVPADTDKSVVTGQGWPTVFRTTDRVEAEKRAADDFDCTLEWLPDGKVKMTGGPYEPTKVFDKERGRKVWFNFVIFETYGASDQSYSVVFKDGTPLPKDVVARCQEIHEELSVDVPWQRGDILILDNFAVMHARRPCYHPRKILVALCR